MMRAIVVASFLSGLVGCSSATSGEEDAPPVLKITSPQRGTFAQGMAVEVTGTVTDDKSGVKVTINGTDVTPAADGSFSTTVNVNEGISILESHAIDTANNDVRDVRAVMAGNIATSDGTNAAPIGARVGTQAFNRIGTALAATAEAIDFNATALAMNPVYDSSGCNSAKIDITSASLSNIDVGLVPAAGVLGAAIAIDNVRINMHVDFRAVCIGGSATVSVGVERARINGDLALAVQNMALSASLPNVSVALDGFSMNINNVPGAIESLVRGEVRKAAEKALTNLIRDKVPPMADDALSGLLAKPFRADLLGHATSFAVVPKDISLSADGLFVAVDTKVKVTGGEGGMYVSSLSPMNASLMPTTGLGVAIADDVLNQLFSGLWAAGAIDQTIGLEGKLAVLASILDDDARSLSIHASLPPTVMGEGNELALAIGDLMLSVKDGSGAEIQNIALSLRTTLAAGPTQTGAVTLTVGQPQLFAQVITQSDVVDRPLTDEQFEGIINGAWGLVGSQADQAMAGFEMPSVAGVTLGAPSIQGRSGYVVADLPVQ